MAQPRGRSNNRRGGGYSNRPGQGAGSRGAAGGGYGARGGASGYGGRGGPVRDNGGGLGTGPLLAIIGGGVVAIGILVFLIASSGGSGIEPLPVTPQQPGPSPVGGGRVQPAVKVLPPLSPAERERVNREIDKLGAREAEASRLIDEGYRAQDEKDYETAQEKWHRAYEMLFEMSEQASALFEGFGGMDGEARVERDCPRAYRTVGKWGEQMARVFKNLKTQ